jgi:hypothetical protein
VPPVEQHLFQLNLLLWMSLPAAPSAIRPVFYEVGYTVWAISPEITAPLAKLGRLRALGASEVARAEMVLHRASASRAVLLECKADSFTLGSSNATQLLLLFGVADNELRDAVGMNPTIPLTSDLLYVLPAGRGTPMAGTFTDAATRFAAESLSCHVGCVLELEERPDGVYAGLVGPALGDAALDAALRPRPRVMTYADPGQDWRPLYLLPIDPSVAGLSTDAVGKSILEERVRAPLLARVGRALGSSFVIDVNDLLRTAIPVWDIWTAPDEKKSLVRFATGLVSALTKELVAVGVSVTVLGGRRYQVQAVSPELAARLRRMIVRSAARNLPLDLGQAQQPELFDDDAESS